jgi:ABC-type enterochelin transport system permease subunit
MLSIYFSRSEKSRQKSVKIKKYQRFLLFLYLNLHFFLCPLIGDFVFFGMIVANLSCQQMNLKRNKNIILGGVNYEI